MKSLIENIVVFDIETTGLKPEKNAIIEVACCTFDIRLENVSEFETGIMSLYDNREVQQQALDANGITMNQIKNGISPEIGAKKLVDYFKSMKKGKSLPILCGHNIDTFDIPFLDNFLTFFGYDLSKFVSADLTLDTLWWARLAWEESTNYKLGTCCSNLGIDIVDAHRAINDTRATKELIVSFLSRLRSEDGQISKENTFRKNFEF